MTGQFLRPALLALAAVPAAQAQTPPAANAPLPGADFLRAGNDPEPDTTAPWRYFPLHVGDAWEYYDYATGERRRVDVLGEEVHNGLDYFTWRSRTYDAGGNVTGSFGPRPVRFDTSTATVRIYFENTDEEWDWFTWVPCPLNVPFDSEVACPSREELPFEVGGDYDGALVFGGEFPGTGEDTVRTAVKTYYSFSPGYSEDFRYAADIGFVYLENELGAEGIYYAKVDGVEYGQPQYPVASEGGTPATGALALSAFPNPFTEDLTVTLEGLSHGLTEFELIDLLGRVVWRESVAVGAGEHTLRLAGGELAPGVYLVQIRTEEGDAATKKVLKL